MANPFPPSSVAASAALLVIAGLLVHLEVRASAQADAVRSLRADVAALHSASRAGAEVPARAPSPVVMRPTFDSDMVQAIARAVVQLEAQQAAAAGAASTRSAAEQDPRGVEEEKAVAHASDVATQAIARGRLSRDDVTRMRQDLLSGHATSEERDAVRSQIAMAVNAQKLVPEDPHFVYP
jgi:hypothetical protein